MDWTDLKNSSALKPEKVRPDNRQTEWSNRQMEKKAAIHRRPVCQGRPSAHLDPRLKFEECWNARSANFLAGESRTSRISGYNTVGRI